MSLIPTNGDRNVHEDQHPEEHQPAVDILCTFGRLNYRAKRMDTALSFARAAEVLSPKSEEIVHLIGSILMETKHKAEAVKVLLRATKLNPRCAGAWYDVGVTLTRLKLNMKARQYFLKALRLNPTQGWIYYCLACLDALESKSEAAFANLELAIAHGFHDAAHMRRDSDLRRLRRDARWKTFLSKLDKGEET